MRGLFAQAAGGKVVTASREVSHEGGIDRPGQPLAGGGGVIPLGVENAGCNCGGGGLIARRLAGAAEQLQSGDRQRRGVGGIDRGFPFSVGGKAVQRHPRDGRRRLAREHAEDDLSILVDARTDHFRQQARAFGRIGDAVAVQNGTNADGIGLFRPATTQQQFGRDIRNGRPRIIQSSAKRAGGVKAETLELEDGLAAISGVRAGEALDQCGRGIAPSAAASSPQPTTVWRAGRSATSSPTEHQADLTPMSDNYLRQLALDSDGEVVENALLPIACLFAASRRSAIPPRQSRRPSS